MRRSPDFLADQNFSKPRTTFSSLAREPAHATTILNILPAVILSATPAGGHETVVLLGLGPKGDGSRLLARITRRSWDDLGLTGGTMIYAQVKGVALAPA